jgi:cytochrome c biogenesis protein CcdA
MSAYAFATISAFWLGVLTSISPCPLATNILAISFISKKITKTRLVILTGLLYTLGRTIAYVALSALLLVSVFSIPQLSQLLQIYINKILGPVLILTGMVLLELISIKTAAAGLGEKTQRKIESMGLFGAVLLGIIFALSFCPVSAALFFGSLIPLSIKHHSAVTLPAFYGFGTALPVALFALLIAFGAKSLAKAFDKLTQLEIWFRRVTGFAFILIGIYFCLRYIFVLF